MLNTITQTGQAPTTIGNGNGKFSSGHSDGSSHNNEKAQPSTAPTQQTNTIGAPAYLWDTRDPDLDDALHKSVTTPRAGIVLLTPVFAPVRYTAQIQNRVLYRMLNGRYGV